MKNLDMNIVRFSENENEVASKCLRLHVRVKGILEAINSGTDSVKMPLTLLKFLHRLVQDGKFLPINYLTKSE